MCETRRGTAAGYSVHMGIFTDHSRNGQVWAYTLGTTHVPRILPPLVTSSWSPVPQLFLLRSSNMEASQLWPKRLALTPETK